MIDLEDACFAEMVALAQKGWPNEVCGVLLGRGDHITSLHPTENAAPEPKRRYIIDPAGLYEAIMRADREGLEIMGFYHSHPRGWDEPSETDAEEATWQDALYMILSFNPVRAGAWRWRGVSNGGFGEVPVRLVRDGDGA